MSEREYYISKRVCPDCRKNSLFGEEKRCPECRAKDAERHAKKYDDPINRQKIIKIQTDSRRERKKRRREQGLCVECGKRKPREGIERCAICRERINKQKRENYQGATLRKSWVADGKCFFCGAECEKGYKVCKVHHQMYIDNAQSDANVANRKRIKEAGLVTAYRRST